MLKIVFRTDASIMIGTGHVMRCLTLADAFIRDGAECTFVCRLHPGNMIDIIEQRGHAVLILPEFQSEFKTTLEDTLHAKWLSTDWQTDAAETAHVLADQLFDWLIVDHYALDSRWENHLRSNYKKLMVIDDLADRQHDCDLLLDQNFGSSIERYHNLIPAHCKQFHGPSYALLKPVYAAKWSKIAARDGQVRRVLIYFGGGADTVDLTGTALQAFLSPELASIDLDIVIGAAYAHPQLLEDTMMRRGNARIHSQLPDLADLMVNADLAIGAGGSTLWERCCLGLPTIVVSIAENQRSACNALFENDLIDYLGHVDDVTAEMIRERVIKMAKNPDALCEMSVKNMALVDGEGVNKVVHLLAQDGLVNLNPSPVYQAR